MMKRFFALLLALALILAALSGTALAAGDGLRTGYFTDAADAAYAGGTPGGHTLNSVEQKIYNSLKASFGRVAAGELSSSEFKLDTTGLGITRSGGRLQGMDSGAVLTALLMDCPYEQYWFDKTEGWQAAYSYSSATGAVSSITFRCAVSQDYAKTAPGGETYYLYQPDPAKTRAAAAAVRNAQAVVEQHKNSSDYDKLSAYRDYICDQVDYHKAAAQGNGYPFGDPWQLVSVFDNDPATNVVCEGYAKAFKYLCDLSSFSNDIGCYLVTGTTTGPHMWNLVRVNGQSYMADLTNSDSEWGRLGDLFLAGAANATADGFTIQCPRHDLGSYHYPATTRSYAYQEETTAYYGGQFLTLAPAKLDPASLSKPAPEPVPVPGGGFADVDPGDFFAQAVDWAVSAKVTNGVTGTTFLPGRSCTHAEILTFLWRAKGEPRDSSYVAPVWAGLEPGHYAYTALGWADTLGMLGGLPANGGPGAFCTRAQAMDYIWAAFGRQAGGSASFSDVPNRYAQAVSWAVDNGITNGTGGGRFSPDLVCDRGTIVTFLHRAFVEEVRLK